MRILIALLFISVVLGQTRKAWMDSVKIWDGSSDYNDVTSFLQAASQGFLDSTAWRANISDSITSARTDWQANISDSIATATNVADSVVHNSRNVPGDSLITIDEASNVVTIDNITQITNRDIADIGAFNAYRIFYSDAGSYVQELALGADSAILFSAGTSEAPEFRFLGDADIPDTITMDNITRITARDINDLNDNSIGRMYYSDGSYQVAGLQLGASGTVLKSTGPTTAPEWGTDLTGTGGAAYTDSIVINGHKTTGDSVMSLLALDTMNLGNINDRDINYLTDNSVGRMYWSNSSYAVTGVQLGSDNELLFSTSATTAPEFRTIIAADIAGLALDMDELESGTASSVLITDSQGEIDYTAFGVDNTILFSTGTGTATEFRTLGDADIPNTLTIDGASSVDMDALESGTANRVMITGGQGEIQYTTFGAANTFWGGNGTTTVPTFQSLVDADIPNTLTIDGASSVDIDALESGTANRSLITGGTGEIQYVTFGGAHTFLEGTSPPTFAALGDADIPNTIAIDIDYLESGTANRVLITDSQGEATYVTFGEVGQVLRGAGTTTAPSFQFLNVGYTYTSTDWNMLYSGVDGIVYSLALGADNTQLFSTGTSSAPEFRSLIAADIAGLALDMDELESGTASQVLITDSQGEIAYTTFGAAATFLGGNGTATAPTFQALAISDLPTSVRTEVVTLNLDGDEIGSPTFYTFMKCPYALTVTECAGYTNTGGVYINVEERAETTPNTAGPDLIPYGDMGIDTDQQELTSFTSGNPGFAANTWMVLTISSVTGSPTLMAVNVKFTKD